MKKTYLDKINSPSELKKLRESEITELCGEIRRVLIDTVSKNGGHLASNLGMVEVTVAMHRVFSSPRDQFVFDVGHQAYTHKLLTGRYKDFCTLRTEGGISGFTRPSESEHDIFATGHSTTSLSAAIGLAEAKMLNNDPSFVVAVIGDGSFTGGMAYEALNNGAKKRLRLIIILNDNKMSISENVGSFASYLAVIRSDPRYFRLKAKTEEIINKIPFVGTRISEGIFEIKTDIKNKIYNRSTFFEDLGFRYMGPVDGHDVKTMCQALESAKMINGPVVLHVSTVKGRGYDFAEKSPCEFHGISKFDIDTGEPIHSGLTFSHVFGEEMCRLAEKDDRICAVTAAMALGTGLTGFSEMFPERFFDVGIAEQHAVTFCAGLAKNGKIPVFAVYSTFLQRSYDQLIHDISLQGLKVIFAVDRAGFVGEDGETHQGIFDVAFISTVPEIKIYCPISFNELRECLDNAVYKDNCPVAVRYPRGEEITLNREPEFDNESYSLFGKKCKKLIITYGRITSDALEAAEKDGNTSVMRLKVIKPLPDEAFKIASEYDRVFFFEEGIRNGGIGQQLALMLTESGFKGKYRLICIENGFVAQASVSQQMKKYRLSSEEMLKIISGD